MARLELSEVRKTYPNGFEAAKGVSLTVPNGSFCALLGPSGCGKSTLLRMIAGLEGVTSGTIALDGVNVTDVHPKDRDMAMVFQSYALYPHLSVAENIAFPLVMKKVSNEERLRRVREAAAQLFLSDVLDRLPGQLSGGQRQRVAVARAIVRNPKVFLFDEPLSNLDAKLRQSTRAELKQLHAKMKVTTVYVTHDQEEAMALADLIVVMSEGRIRQIGSPLDLYESPADRFVAGFIGSPAMNFFDCEIDASGVMHTPLSGVCGINAANQVAGNVIWGVRPSSVRLRVSDDGAGAIIAVEPLGEFSDVTLEINGCRVRSRIESSRALAPGMRVCVSIDGPKTHVFSANEEGARFNCKVGSFNPAGTECLV